MADQQRPNFLIQFFRNRFSLRDNALWRVMGLLKPYRRMIVLANICLGVSQIFAGVSIVALYPLINYALEKPAAQSSPAPGGAAGSVVGSDTEHPSGISENMKGGMFEKKLDQVPFYTWMKGSTLRYFTVYSAILILLFLLKGLIQFAGNYMMARVSINVTSDLMNRVYGNVLRQEMAFFDRTSLGTLLNLCYREIFNMQPLITMLASTRVILPITMLVLFMTLVGINAYLAFMLLVLLPIVIVPTMLVTRWMRQSMKGELAEESEVMDIMTQGLGGILAIKTFGAERFEQKYLEPAVAAYVESSRSRRAAQSIVAPMVDLLNIMVLLLVFVFAMIFLRDRISLSAGMLTAFMVALTRFYKPMTTIMRMDVNMHRAQALAKRVFELLDRIPGVRNAPDPVDFPADWDRIEFENTSLNYTVHRRNRPPVQREALKPTTLTIKRGEAVGIIGPNGAGKSSIMKLLCRLYDPTGGRIRIGMVPLDKIRLETFAHNICLLTQHPILFNRSVRDNITFSLEGISDEQVEAAARAAGAHEFVQKLPNGYDSLIGENGKLLSGGERQKVMLARAFVRRPSILILDEPTTGLDQKTLNEFLESVWKLHEQGITIIYITHEQNYLNRFDRVFEFKADHSVKEKILNPNI